MRKKNTHIFVGVWTFLWDVLHIRKVKTTKLEATVNSIVALCVKSKRVTFIHRPANDVNRLMTLLANNPSVYFKFKKIFLINYRLGAERWKCWTVNRIIEIGVRLVWFYQSRIFRLFGYFIVWFVCFCRFSQLNFFLSVNVFMSLFSFIITNEPLNDGFVNLSVVVIITIKEMKKTTSKMFE